MTSAQSSRPSFRPLVAAAVALFFATVLLQSPALAAGTMPLSGYAWSANVGWISFGGSGYGVVEDTTTRELSGYAWSSNVGWISFSASDGSHPAPAVHIVTGQVTGWARACAAFADKNACSGALDGNSGGWDGWIALSGTALDGSPYGIVQSGSCAWTGYAWGSDSIGWISAGGTAADGSAYGVSGNNPSVCASSCVASLTATPDPIEQGEVPTLVWSVSEGSGCASSCSGSGFDTGGAISGSAPASVPPAPPSTSYALTCTAGTYGSPPPANATVTVIVPEVTITANGQSGSARVNPTTTDNTSIAWSSENATSCAVTKNGSAWQTGPGSSGTNDTVTAQTTYTADCVNAGGTHVTASVIVNILPGFQEF
ncbi:MAG: hypothetical protein NUV90_03050 [Candidatus Parcubacteria bacterium]|nr:hypothetical protein [Candidatus Parcubacteria bacterium]